MHSYSTGTFEAFQISLGVYVALLLLEVGVQVMWYHLRRCVAHPSSVIVIHLNKGMQIQLQKFIFPTVVFHYAVNLTFTQTIRHFSPLCSTLELY